MPTHEGGFGAATTLGKTSSTTLEVERGATVSNVVWAKPGWSREFKIRWEDGTVAWAGVRMGE